MVLFVLQMKAELEGVQSVELKPDTDLCISIRNPMSDYEVRENVLINIAEYLESDFNINWEDNSSTIPCLRVLTPSQAKTALKKHLKRNKGGDEFQPRPYTSADSGNFLPILMVECRGMEPYALTVGTTEFVVTADSGALFDENVHVPEGDWADYDEEADAPVALSEVEFKWQSVK